MPYVLPYGWTLTSDFQCGVFNLEYLQKPEGQREAAGLFIKGSWLVEHRNMKIGKIQRQEILYWEVSWEDERERKEE